MAAPAKIALTDSQKDSISETTLLQKMETYIDMVGSSQFYHALRDQIQTTLFDYFHRVLGSEKQMPMVIYGIGSIDLHEPPRLQLSMALLLKRDFSWIGNIEVFDPILSVTESRVLEALGCSVMSINEHARREAIKPTLFFMPHCKAGLYNNLLKANWKPSLLRNIALFGNSFERYEQQQHILAVRKFTNEFKIETVSDDYYYNAFHDSSWHFFQPCG